MATPPNHAVQWTGENKNRRCSFRGKVKMGSKKYDLKQKHISKALSDYLDDLDFKIQHPKDINGLSTGIKNLDMYLNGIRPGQVILVGGRPAMGKTYFAVNLAYNMAIAFSKENIEQKKCILYFSLDTSLKLLSERFISVSADISTYDLQNEIHNAKEFEKVADAVHLLEKLPIYISENGYNIDMIREEANKINACNPIGCIFIDYLQLMDRKTSDCTLVMQEIQELAVSLNIPIIVLSQLTRDLENRRDKHPMLTDVRGFGKKHITADKVLFLYRESYYINYDEPTKKRKETEEHFKKRLHKWENRCQEVQNLCEILIAKNNDGTCDCVNTYFNPSSGLFKDYPDEPDDL